MAKEEINAFLGTGTSYQGKLIFQGSVRIDGDFNGEIESEGTLVVGKEARVKGTITVGQLVQSGGIEGDVRAKEKAVLYKDADFYGTLQAPVMVVEEGARVKGQVNMGENGRELPAREPEAVESGEG